MFVLLLCSVIPLQSLNFLPFYYHYDSKVNKISFKLPVVLGVSNVLIFCYFVFVNRIFRIWYTGSSLKIHLMPFKLRKRVGTLINCHYKRLKDSIFPLHPTLHAFSLGSGAPIVQQSDGPLVRQSDNKYHNSF